MGSCGLCVRVGEEDRGIGSSFVMIVGKRNNIRGKCWVK